MRVNVLPHLLDDALRYLLRVEVIHRIAGVGERVRFFPQPEAVADAHANRHMELDQIDARRSQQRLAAVVTKL